MGYVGLVLSHREQHDEETEGLLCSLARSISRRARGDWELRTVQIVGDRQFSNSDVMVNTKLSYISLLGVVLGEGETDTRKTRNSYVENELLFHDRRPHAIFLVASAHLRL